MSARPPVRPGDRVSDVLARDLALVEVFARHSPHFARLRNPAMRRVMARLVTVEQAARVCGAPVDVLVRDLNRALGIEGGAVAPAADAPAPGGATAPAAQPATESGASASLAGEPEEGAQVIELDVRPDLREGREPFARIMAAFASLPDGAVLHLRAPFEPAPLYAVMEKRGFVHHTRQDAPDDWSVWFRRGAAPAATREPAPSPAPVAPPPPATTGAAPSSSAAAGAPAPAAAEEIVLDVRGMEPPEPMVRTLAALEHLPEGAVLLQINARVPQFLLPLLTERGFAYELDVTRPEEVKVRIYRMP